MGKLKPRSSSIRALGAIFWTLRELAAPLTSATMVQDAQGLSVEGNFMRGTCHCGAVSWTLNCKPARLVECNCSICRRLGALWAHMAIADVHISGSTSSYVRRDADCDGEISFNFCKLCGVTTHWSPTEEGSDRMAVNARLAEPADIEGIELKHFDGADTWKFLD